MSTDPRPTETEATTVAGFSRARIRQLVHTARSRLRSTQQAPGSAGGRRYPIGRLLHRWLEPITVIGWTVLGIATVTLATGLLLSWRELVVIGAAAFVLMLIAGLFAIGQTRYRVRLDLEYTRVVAGERALGQIEIEAVATRALVPASVEVPVGQEVAIFDLPRMAPGDVHEDIFVIPTARRGVLTVGPVRSVRGDALGLVRRNVRWTKPIDLYVHPKTVLLADASIGMLRDLEGLSTRELTDSDISFHALRDYVPGDDRRHIHWKSTARTGALMVRQFEQTKRSRVTLGLSAAAAEYAHPQEFETAVSVVGSLGLQAIRDDLQLSVRSTGRQLAAQTGRSLLDSLSTVEYEPGSGGLRQLVQQVARHDAASTLVVLLTGAAATADEIRSARRLLPGQTRVVACRVRPAEPVGVVSGGDLTMLSLQNLAQLPLMVRRLQEV